MAGTNEKGAPTHDVFATTRWTQVLAAQGNTLAARHALSDLCASYYAPVVAFLRREGRDEDAARELAHEFFACILERHSLPGVDPALGRFRCYLLGALKHFLGNQRVWQSRDKRGGGLVHASLNSAGDTSALETLGGCAPPASDALFDREWALSILRRALVVLKQESEAGGNLPHFQALNPWLTGEDPGRSQSEAARQLGLSETAVRVAIHRLRRRFRELVKAEIGQTVSDPSEIGDELRYLIEAVS